MSLGKVDVQEDWRGTYLNGENLDEGITVCIAESGYGMVTFTSVTQHFFGR